MTYHKTAITRNKPSYPAKWVADNIGFAKNNLTLDFGAGRGFDASFYNLDAYDPSGYNYPVGDAPAHGIKYKTILCTYVLNTIEWEWNRKKVLDEIKGWLTEDGVAYVSVRNDKANLNGRTSRNTYQGHVQLNYPVVHKNSNCVIYEIHKNSPHIA